MTVVVVVASVVVALVLAVIEKQISRRKTHQLSSDVLRHNLRLRVVAKREDEPIRLGASHPDRLVVVGPEALRLEVDDEQRVVLEPGTRLRLSPALFEQCTGRAERALAITRKTPFWVLDSPKWKELPRAEGEPRGARRLLSRDEPWELTTDVIPDRAAPQREGIVARALPLGVLATGLFAFVPGMDVYAAIVLASLASVSLAWRAHRRGQLPAGVDGPTRATWNYLAPLPIWLYRLQDPSEWLCGPRRVGARRVFVQDLTDPHTTAAEDPRDEIVDVAAHVIADAVWMETELPATIREKVVLGRFFIHPLGNAPSADTLGLDDVEEPFVIVRGEAQADLAAQGFVIWVRDGREGEDTRIAGPLETLPHLLAQHLAERGWTDLRAPRASLPPLTREQIPEWCSLVRFAVRAAAMDSGTQAIPPRSVASMREGFDRCEAFARAHPDNGRAQLLWVVVAIYTHRLQALDGTRRARVLDAIRAAPEGHLLADTAPASLVALGETAEARRIAEAHLARGVSGYRDAVDVRATWLRKVLDVAQ